jgi:hypothetical protein
MRSVRREARRVTWAHGMRIVEKNSVYSSASGVKARRRHKATRNRKPQSSRPASQLSHGSPALTLARILVTEKAAIRGEATRMSVLFR